MNTRTGLSDAEFFRYQRLLGATPDGLQMKVTVITDSTGRIRSASIQMRAVEGPVSLTAEPASWSTPFTLTPNVIGQELPGGDAA